MEKARVTIALPNREASEKTAYVLQRSGYFIADICISGREAIRKVRTSPPDILIINFDMPDMTGMETATVTGDMNLCSVVLLVTSTQRDFCAELTEDYDITLFVKPVGVARLLDTLESVLAARRRMAKLEKELDKLKRSIEDRKVINKAKGILIKRKSISEAEAYRRIQKMSMDSRVPMRSIAHKIIELAEGKKPGQQP